MKKILPLLIILALILTACGGTDDPIVIPDFERAPPRDGGVRLAYDADMAQILNALYNFRVEQQVAYLSRDMCPTEDDLSELYAHLNPFYGETLTISVMADFGQPYLRLLSLMDYSNVRYFADSYMRQNPGVTIEVRNHGGRNAMLSELELRRVIHGELAAGTASTLFNLFGAIDPLSDMAAEHLANWYPIMRSDPRFFENDWFMNVFYAMMVNDRLLSLPIFFSFNLLAANNTVPGLADAFAQHDYVTYDDIMTLHGRFAPRLYVHEMFGPVRAFMLNRNDFVDINAGRLDFSNMHLPT